MVRILAVAAFLLTGFRFAFASADQIGPVPYGAGVAWWALASAAAFVAAITTDRRLVYGAGFVVAALYVLWPAYVAFEAPTLTSTLGAAAAHFALTGVALATLYTSLPSARARAGA